MNTASSTTNQITLPVDADGGYYNPRNPVYTYPTASNWKAWIPFVAQPVGSLPIVGLGAIPEFPEYDPASDARDDAADAWLGSERLTTWRQQDNVVAGGVSYEVWVLSRDTLTAGRLDEAAYIFYRTGDGFGE